MSLIILCEMDTSLLQSTDVSLKAVSPESDGDFDFQGETADDDERTIEEEEQLDSRESFTNELDDLQQEADIPVADLIAMYYPAGNAGSPVDDDDDTDDSTGEILSSNDLSLDKEEVARDLLPDETKLEEEEEQEEDTPEKSPESGFQGNGEGTFGHGTHRLLRSSTAGPDDESDMDSEDSEYVPLDEWKKDINVGRDFQAAVPEGLSPYDDGPVYENEDALLWDPSKLEDGDVEDFLSQIQLPSHGPQDGNSIPSGTHVRDDEKALFILLQCGHSVDEALRRNRMQIVAPTDELSLWSEEECRNFESGLRTYGKNFYLIHRHKVRTRSVGELVHFYYLWKKTERHDAFSHITRLSKKKYHVHPGITDYMDRFLDDSESVLSPTPAHSMLDRNRLNKPTVLPSVNGGSMELQNSPEIGGIVTSDLPKETSHSDDRSVRLTRVSEQIPTGRDMGPPIKRYKLDKEVEAEILKNLDSLVAIPDLLEGSLQNPNRITQELISTAHGPISDNGENIPPRPVSEPVTEFNGTEIQSSNSNNSTPANYPWPS
ncbi:mesoderm induction early response protein 1-like isoform X3 [Apostichopus japonicus]|uniref:mesoderm induction early response protein 1-like isoform X3 n=1 Tax=Stichopus japonicus TaxID=307972 RepID=UPI003AB823CF